MGVLKTGTASFVPGNAYSFTYGNYYTEDMAGITGYELYHFMQSLTRSGGQIAGLFLYKGTLATQSELDGISLTTLVGNTSKGLRPTDLLCYFPTTGTPTWSGYDMKTLLSPAKALGTGTATWFMFGSYYGNSSYPVCGLISGTVGAVGSGSDLEIDTLNYTAGILYKLSSYTLTFPNGYAV